MASAVSPVEARDNGNKQRQSNQQRKQDMREWPIDKKLGKLAIYSSCQEDANCKCNGWKNPNPMRLDEATPTSTPSDLCRTCSHRLSSHVSHLQAIKEEELDRLLAIVVDVETLFTCVHKEEDGDTKRVYLYLFKLLRRCILQLSKPSVECPLGNPPYEKPSIAKGVTNFVLFKFNHLSPKEWQMMYDLAKLFLNLLNRWKLETPTSSEDASAYKVNYVRWLCYCHVPAFCDSLPRYDTTCIFGRCLLKSVFQVLLLTMVTSSHNFLPSRCGSSCWTSSAS
jgi:histone acetyltransferase